jgi:hypothetical protein
MATHSGRKGQITINYDTTELTVGELNTWSLNISAGSTDTSTFGDKWGKSDVGMLTANGSASGFYDPDDAGQVEFWDNLVSGDLVDTLRLYAVWSDTSSDAIKYWQPDIGNDPEAGARITAFNTGQTASGVATFDISFDWSGPVQKVETTVP